MLRTGILQVNRINMGEECSPLTIQHDKGKDSLHAIMILKEW